MVDGSFDPLHAGHLAYFRAARSLGAPLLCNVCPDAETAQKHPVLLPAADRAEILDHLDLLQYVHVSERPTVEILRQIQPRAYVKGGDWVDRLPDAIGQTCAELGIRMVYTDKPAQSSSGLLKQFQPDVDAFERLVLSQQPASAPWQPVTDYSFEARKAIEAEHVKRLWQAFSALSVLDYGCGYGHLVRLMREAGISAFGYEPYVIPDSTVRDVINGSLGVLAAGDFDVIVCREVMEHLTILEIRQLVTHLCALTKKYVYVTTRFAHAPRHFLSVDTADELDPTHRTMLHQDFLRTLFVLEGMKRNKALEQHLDHAQKGRVLVYERVA